MNYINVGKENSGSIDLYYEDHGKGSPVLLIHGWPLSGTSWEKQTAALLASGHRVITYDRRGFGWSSRPATGYDYDTFADDLNKIVTKLDLHDVTLVGFSMGGGEVARYLGKYGSERVSKAVFMAAIPPYLLKTADNAGGVDKAIFEGIQKAIIEDRPKFISAFLADFYNANVLGGKLISDQVMQYSWNVAAGASAKGTLDCVAAWLTDFRKDVSRIDVPTLIIHGDADRILPIASTAIPLSKMIKGSQLVVVEGGPHGIIWTHADKVNSALLEFLELKTQKRAAA